MENVNENAIIDDKENKKGKAVKKFVPPTLEDVKEFFVSEGYLETVAEKVFRYYDDANWHDSKGSPVKNWKQKCRGVWFKPENLDRTKIKDEFSHLQGYNPELHNNPLYRYEIAPTGKAIGYWRK